MQGLLKEYEDVFQEPSSLPPAREVDHCIMVKEGTEPINVRPSKYAHFQKVEIEKQCWIPGSFVLPPAPFRRR